jgi:CII-binding regulator of phage lambda lysogenization HflD
MIAVDIAVVAGSLTILAMAVGVVRQILIAMLELQRNLSRLRALLQQLATRITAIERYLERNTEFLGVTGDTGFPDIS